MTSSSTEETCSLDFPVVGLGASAGGVGPLAEFFEALPERPGIAFVVILHLAPCRSSHLSEIVGRHTKLPTEQVTGDTPVRSDHVYVIPPGQHISLREGDLRLSDLEQASGERTAIDHFLRSLAEDQGPKAGAVILSGTGSDGMLGLRRIKEAGGLTLVQALETSKYGGMPESAIGTGMVDAVLPAAELGPKLTEYFHRQSTTEAPTPDELSESDARALEDILMAVHARTNDDFSQYKRSTILRRIGRRMQVRGAKDLSAYREVIEDRPEEAQKLTKEFLISVTHFFREPAAFEALQTEVIPELFAERDPSDQLRVWAAGCATGEEAYSLAIVLLERASTLVSPPDIQVFATDIDRDALDVARRGVYPASIAEEVSGECLERFFQKHEDGYIVSRELRSMITFAEHNLLRDPPFSHLDLVSCRNLLIYLGRDVQKKVFELFHFALRPGGALFLGTSESAESASDLFLTLDKRQSLYRRRPVDSTRLEVPTLPLLGQNARQVEDLQASGASVKSGFGQLHQQLAANRLAPPSAVVDEQHNIVHLASGFGRFLRDTDGPISRNLLEKLSPDLRASVRRALGQIAHKEKSRTSQEVCPAGGEGAKVLHVTVEAIEDPEGFFLVAIEERHLSSPQHSPAAAAERDAGDESVIEKLEDELERTEQELQHTIEDYETSMEELQSSNEELMSMNEELQSTTEELETSKEELTTVNEKLSGKIEELRRANSDLKNLMAATEVGVIFVDKELRVQRFTLPAAGLFNLIESDVGRPLSDITSRLEQVDLTRQIHRVIEQLEKIRREVSTEDGSWYIMRIRPYRTVEDTIEGAVLTFVDITERKDAEEALQKSHEELEERVEERTAELRESKAHLEAIVQAMPDLLLQISKEGEIVKIEGLQRTGALEDGRHYMGKTLDEILPETIAGRLSEASARAAGSGSLQTMHFTRERSDGNHREFEARITPIEETATLIIIRDVTERRHMEREVLRFSEEERQMIGRELHDGLGQVFTGLSMLSRSLIDELDERGSDLLADAEQIYRRIKEADELSHRLLRGMAPLRFDADDAGMSLHRLANRTEEMLGVNITVEADEQVDVKDDVMLTHLLRIAQEATTNSVKHGAASRITLRLELTDEHIRLEVADNGTGLPEDFNMKDCEGLGLKNMLHRAQLMDGDLDLRRGEEDGAVLVCTVPRK